ncbi:MFS transporter, PPP family, 3-phenylpropionic acid transporter [Devosia lucknowensis]|uniref:MFS transporter, PPP family, 3-phenylpropionic acid transporter n=1 Tax=Devosia lucknowensis TaxID=1096929 RepID=A0A1Y6EW92_9HYPH|nr:MFS transporter [Devosia lucknowensis]SMQ66944.1 MFS transporter, PPP family, 3-phenylpropionic acid transporter [Devosia lucknowensis]
MSPVLSRLDSPELRASIYQFTVYLPGGVASVFLGIWLSEHGIPADQIGVINALPTLGLLMLNMIVGRVADKADDWRSALIVLSIASALAPLPLYFVSEFWGILLVWALCATSNGLVAPVIDAATVRMTRRNGTDFGVIRAWATVGYIVGAGGLGMLLNTLGSGAFVTLYVAMVAARAFLAFLLPRFRAPAQKVTLAEPVAAGPVPSSRLRDALQPWFVLPLLAFALVNSSNSIIGSFGALLWHENGIPSYFLGPLLGFAAVGEAILMFAWRRFGGRVTARNMILVGAIAGLIRFTIMAFNPPVEVLFMTQFLHAFSFGMGYFGVVHFIANWTNEANAAEAQGFANMLNMAMAMLALIAFGVLVEHFGSHAFFFSTVTSLLAVGCVLLSLKLRPPKALLS